MTTEEKLKQAAQKVRDVTMALNEAMLAANRLGLMVELDRKIVTLADLGPPPVKDMKFDFGYRLEPKITKITEY